jgi:transposase
MGRELLEDDYIQVDETPVGVQMHDGQGKNRQAYLWQYSRPKGPVVFDFRLGREREGPKRFLGNFGGILQSDGYGGYDRVGGPRIVHADCWAHARRKFFDAVKLNPKDQTAIGIVAQMDHVRLVRRLRSIRRPLAKITSNPRAGRIWRVRVYGSSAQTGNVN